jgi:hypothetical protein
MKSRAQRTIIAILVIDALSLALMAIGVLRTEAQHRMAVEQIVIDHKGEVVETRELAKIPEAPRR